MEKEAIYQKLLAELNRSLIVDDETSKFWSQNYTKLPLSAVKVFCDELSKTNRHVDEMVAAGIDADPALGDQIIQKTKAVKLKNNKFVEKQIREEENPEKLLAENLTNIN